MLTRNGAADGTTTYLLRFGKETQCEVTCPSGRYDLDLFAGYEVGVLGTERREPTASGVPGILITRLEILSRR